MPLSDEVVSDNPDYCKYCHADGHFTQDCTMDEMIEVCVQFLDEFNKNTASSSASTSPRSNAGRNSALHTALTTHACLVRPDVHVW